MSLIYSKFLNVQNKKIQDNNPTSYLPKVHYRQYCQENFKSFYEYPKDTSLINTTLLPLILTKAIGGINLNVQMNILLQNVLFTILSIGKQDLFINTK